MRPANRYLVSGLGAVILLMLAAAAGVIGWNRHITQTQTLVGLQSVHQVEARLQNSHMSALQLRAHTLATDPAFVDYVAQSLLPNPQLGGAIDSASINNLLNERRKGYDAAMVLDAKGKLITRSGIPLRSNSNFQRDALVRKTIRTHKPSAGLWSGQGQLARVAVEPLLRGQVLEGVLVAATRVKASFATQVSRFAHSGMAVLVPGESGAAIPVSSTLDPSTHDALARDDPTLMNLTDPGGRAIRIATNSGPVQAWISPLPVTDGKAVLVALNSDASVPWYSIPVAALPYLLGILIPDLIAIVWVCMLWRRTWRPLQDMQDILERAAAGEKGITLRTGGNKAIRNMRDVINQVLKHTED
jgi:hypothetical protein